MHWRPAFSKLHHWGLRAKIITWVFVPTVVISLAVALVAFYASQQVTEELVVERDKAVIHLAAEDLSARLRSYSEYLNTLARLPDFYSGSADGQRAALERSASFLALFDGGVVVLDSSGRVAAAQPRRDDILMEDWSDRPYYQTYAVSRIGGVPAQATISNILSDGPDGAPVVAVVTPIIGEQGEFRGVLVGMFRINSVSTNSLYADILKFNPSKSGEAYVVDQYGRVVYHTIPEYVGTDFSQQPIVRAVITGQDPGALRTSSPTGEQIVAGYAPIADTPWGFVVEESWEELTSRSSNYQTSIILLLFMGVILPAIVVNIRVRRILQPITDLTLAVQEVAQGNFGRTIQARTGDEIEALADQFNSMSQQLQASYSHLEDKVAARTHELSTLNAIAEVVNRSLDLDEILRSALEKTLHLLGVERGSIFLLEDVSECHNLAEDVKNDEVCLVLRVQRGNSAEMVAAMRHMRTTEGVAGKALQMGRPVVLNASDYPAGRLAPRIFQEGIRSLAGAPILSKEQPLGVLTLATLRERAFPAQELDLLAAIGQQVGVAVEKARLYEQAQKEIAERKRAEEALQRVSDERARRNQELALVNRIIAAAASRQDLQAVLETVCQELGKIFLVDRAAAALLDESGKSLSVMAEYHLPGVSSSLGMEIPLQDNEVTRQVLETRQAMAIDDAQNDPRMADLRPLMVQQDIASILIVPLVVQDQALGTIGLDASQRRIFTPEEINLAANIAAAASQAVERARAEDALRKAKESAEMANRSKSIFLANMSHELRTPLNAILGFAQLMGRDPKLDAEQQDNLQTIQRSGEHLLNLINDVLEMSKIEAGRTTLYVQPTDFHRLLAMLESMFRLRAEDKGLLLMFERHPDVPRYLRLDEGKLRQVLINLLSNAIKFTQAGGVTLRVRCLSGEAAQEEDQTQLEFEVQDTGVGIAPEDQKVLFDPFVQTTSGKKSQEGTGLGLAISQQFVRLMGGAITLESEPGQGSLFRFGVLVEPADQSDVQSLEKTESARRVVGLEPGQGPFRLLVVEDKAANRRLLVRLLSSFGFEVREALNGKEAIDIWQDWQPHLIWMDMRMPVMNGHEATRHIKSRLQGQSTVIVALTASAFEEDRLMVLSEGCDDFVRKPFREQEIYDKLEKYLGVRFIYQDMKPIPEIFGDGDASQLWEHPEQNIPAMRAALLSLDPQWVADLGQAAVQADAEWLEELIIAIEARNATLASALANLVHNFRFDIIMALARSEGDKT